MYIYTVSYLSDDYNRIYDYVLAANDRECMDKFNAHHPDANEEGYIVDWHRIDY